jgi:hypothetical protein
MANHIPVREIAHMIGWLGLGGNLAEIAGVVLVAIAMFQRRPGSAVTLRSPS